MERFDRRRVGITLASGAAAVAAGFLVTAGSPRWIVFALAQTALFFLPDALFRFGIEQLGDLSQPLLVVGATAGAIVVLGSLAWLALRLSDAPGRTRAEAVFATLVTQTIVGFALTIAPVASFAGGLAGALVVGVSGIGGGADRASRRGLLQAGAAAFGLLGAGGLLAGQQLRGRQRASDEPVSDPLVERLLASADERSLDVSGIDGLVSTGFYEVDISPGNPDIDRAAWSLSVGGAVDQPQTLSFDELTQYPMEHRFVSLRCVGEELNGHKLDTALWTGVPAEDVLADADPDGDACCVLVRAADDYYQEFPREALEDATLAVRMNGRPLPRAHGAPVRLLVPGHWGEINIKWITDLELVTEPQEGYWEKRGWYGTGQANTVAKLHAVDVSDTGSDASGGSDDDAAASDASRVTLGGHAYAGTRGLSAVEVSRDGGTTWERADLSDPLPDRVPVDADPDDPSVVDGQAADAWRMWQYSYTASEPHEVVVRAIEADGTVQPREESNPFPRGASGWVSRQIEP